MSTEQRNTKVKAKGVHPSIATTAVLAAIKDTTVANKIKVELQQPHQTAIKALQKLNKKGYSTFNNIYDFFAHVDTVLTEEEKTILSDKQYLEGMDAAASVISLTPEVVGIMLKECAGTDKFKELGMDLSDRIIPFKQQLAKQMEEERTFDFYPITIAPQTVNTIVAPTNIGKTTLAVALTSELGKDGKALMLSTEESEIDLTRKFSKLPNLSNINFLVQYKLTEELIKELFQSLQAHNFKYIVIDYANPFNIEIEADLAEKIDRFYQWLIEAAQAYNVAVFVFMQANAKAYNEKINPREVFKAQPNNIASFVDGGVRAMFKSYSAVYIHKEDGNRYMIPCKSRSEETEGKLGVPYKYDVNLSNYSLGAATPITNIPKPTRPHQDALKGVSSRPKKGGSI